MVKHRGDWHNGQARRECEPVETEIAERHERLEDTARLDVQ